MDHDTDRLAPAPAVLERQAAGLRNELRGLVGELDRRRRAFFDWHLQLRRHGWKLGVAAGVLLLGAGGLAWARHARARPRRWWERRD